MLTGLTGIPVPTTGGTRSMRALWQGDLIGSLYYNAFTLPIVGLTLFTLVHYLLRRGTNDRWLSRTWCILLAVAWLAKLLSPPETW